MHIDAVQDNPVEIWTTLASIHLQQRPGAYFNAWDDFVETTQRKERPDWGLNPGPSGTAPGALTTELPGLGYT